MSAKEMFKMLDYDLVENTNTRLTYQKNDKNLDYCKEIWFYIEDLTFGSDEDINMEELQAIIKQLEEIGSDK